MFRLKLHWQILIAIGFAVLIGLSCDAETTWAGIPAIRIFGFLGDLFLRALTMLVVPLIMASIISGVASIGRPKALGRLGGKTAAYYLATSLLAVLVGLAFANGVQCGDCDGQPCRDQIGLTADVSTIQQKVEGRSAGDIVQVFLRMIPKNVVEDAAAGRMLGLIFFSMLFGFFITRLADDTRDTMTRFWAGTNDVMLKMTEFVMLFAPFGVFGLVARTVATTGFNALGPLVCFASVVFGALATHVFVVLPTLLVVVGRVSPLKHYRAMLPALLMAFSTASSSATLPLTMECAEKGAGVSRRVTSFTLPLGATINMDGTALYECSAALFIAQAYGVHLSFSDQFLVVIIAVLTSIGVAGIPSASLVAITLILTTIGLPLEAVGLILAVDRILDMCRTAVNVLSDSTAAVVIARTEGEETLVSRGRQA